MKLGTKHMVAIVVGAALVLGLGVYLVTRQPSASTRSVLRATDSPTAAPTPPTSPTRSPVGPPSTTTAVAGAAVPTTTLNHAVAPPSTSIAPTPPSTTAAPIPSLAETPEQAFAIAAARDQFRFAGVALGPELGGIADARLYPLLRGEAVVGGVTIAANPYWEVNAVFDSIEAACAATESWLAQRSPSHGEYCGAVTASVDPTTTYALVHVDLTSHSIRLMQWVYAEEMEDWIVGEEFSVAFDPNCHVVAVDGSSRTLERLAEYINDSGGTDIPPVFQLTPDAYGSVVEIREMA